MVDLSLKQISINKTIPLCKCSKNDGLKIEANFNNSCYGYILRSCCVKGLQTPIYKTLPLCECSRNGGLKFDYYDDSSLANILWEINLPNILFNRTDINLIAIDLLTLDFD